MSLSGQWAGHPQGMIMNLDTARLRTFEQVEAFLQGTAEEGFSPAGIGALHLDRAHHNPVCVSGVRMTPARVAAPLYSARDRLFLRAGQPLDRQGRLSAHRQRSSGRSRGNEGNLLHQCRRLYDPVPGRLRCGRDQ